MSTKLQNLIERRDRIQSELDKLLHEQRKSLYKNQFNDFIYERRRRVKKLNKQIQELNVSTQPQ